MLHNLIVGWAFVATALTAIILMISLLQSYGREEILRPAHFALALGFVIFFSILMCAL